MKSIKEGPSEDQSPGIPLWTQFLDRLPEPPGADIPGRGGAHPGTISISVVEVENKKTRHGSFLA